jgi:hypothetical protein
MLGNSTILLALAPSFASLLQYASLRGTHAFLDLSLPSLSPGGQIPSSAKWDFTRSEADKAWVVSGTFPLIGW